MSVIALTELVLAMLGVAAKLERRRIKERTERGRSDAKAKGVKFGRSRSSPRTSSARRSGGGTRTAKRCARLPAPTMSARRRFRGSYKYLHPLTLVRCLMTKYFSAERIAELNANQKQVYRQFRDLQERFFLRTYKSQRGEEYAKHGFCRRLDTLVRAVGQVYELLPPQQEEIPDDKNVVDATISIQAFVMNAFGCLENIAWIWLYEKNVRNDNGTELDPKEVGLGKKKLRKALTQQFRDYLDKDEKKKWLGNLIDFGIDLRTGYRCISCRTSFPRAISPSTRRSTRQNGRNPR